MNLEEKEKEGTHEDRKGQGKISAQAHGGGCGGRNRTGKVKREP